MVVYPFWIVVGDPSLLRVWESAIGSYPRYTFKNTGCFATTSRTHLQYRYNQRSPPCRPRLKPIFHFLGFFSFFSLSNVFLSEQNVLPFPRKEMALITIIPAGMICADEACGNGGPHVGLSPEDKLDRLSLIHI